LTLRGIPFERQKDLIVRYKDLDIPRLRLDSTGRRPSQLQTRRRLKSSPVREAQFRSHLKTTRLRLGLLINFRVRVLKDGIERVVR
jgi:GxxExxY protein